MTTLSQPKLTIGYTGGSRNGAAISYQGATESLEDFLSDSFRDAFLIAPSDTQTLIAEWLCEDGPQRVPLDRNPGELWRDFYARFRALAEPAIEACPPEPDPS